MDQIVTRQEVWKYRKVFDGYERDWLKVPFKKLDIGLISEKVAQHHSQFFSQLKKFLSMIQIIGDYLA